MFSHILSHRITGLILVILQLSSCTFRSESFNDPKRRLSDYISQTFSIKTFEDRGLLLGYLTGNVKSRLESWSEDQFQEAFIDSKRQFLKLSFKEVKNISQTEVQITYELVFMDKSPGKDGKGHEAKITNKKLCQMVLEKGKWLISDVRNIKELIEYKDELSLP